MEVKLKEVSSKTLNNINMTIPDGFIVSIIGDLQSGKTELLELIDILNQPNNGLIEFNGVISKKKEIRKKIGFVFKNPELQFFSTTVDKELKVALNLLNEKQNQNEKVKNVLKLVGLNECLLNHDPLTLSSGEKRKLAIASILIYNPELILFDEPLLALDYESRKNILKLIRNLKQGLKKTIIIATSDTELALQVSDYIYILNKGEIVLEGTKYEVFKEKGVLLNSNLTIPKVIEFSNYVREKKKINLGYRDDVNDLIKDIYRYAK